MTFYTHCRLCDERFESEHRLRITMWRWSHARKNHPEIFRKALRQKMGRKVE